MNHVFVLMYGDQTWALDLAVGCGMDLNCSEEWQSQYPLGVALPCRFDLNNPLGTVTIGGKLRDPYERARCFGLLIASFVFFGIAFCLCLWIVFVFGVDQARNMSEICMRIHTRQAVDQSEEDEFVTAKEPSDSFENKPVDARNNQITFDEDTAPPPYSVQTSIDIPTPLALPNYSSISISCDSS